LSVHCKNYLTPKRLIRLILGWQRGSLDPTVWLWLIDDNENCRLATEGIAA